MSAASRLLVLACAAFVACDDNAATTGPPPSLAPVNGTHLAITFQTPPGAILSGGTIDVLVTVARDGIDAYDGDVNVTLAPTDGFSAKPLTIAQAATGAKLTLAVTADRKQGVVPLRILAVSADQKATGEAKLSLTVRGKPGTLDTSFGSGGIFLLGEADARATGLALQSDGKIVLGGRIGMDAAVVRLTAEGKLDSGFGAGGRARAAIGGVLSTNDVVLLSDGAIILGGTGTNASFLARFAQTGDRDLTFGAQGIVSEPSQTRSSALAIADGKLYLGGQSSTANAEDAQHIAHLLPTGALDLTRGVNGQALLPFASSTCALGPGACFTSAISTKTGGRLTMCASLGDGVNFRELVANGNEDRNYDLTTSSAVLSRCVGIVNNTPADFWAAGARDSGIFQILHFKAPPQGGPLGVDPNMHPPVLPAEAAIGMATRLTVASSGLLLTSADATPNGGPTQIALVRMNAFTLALDPNFAGKGYVSTSIGTTPAHSLALAVQGDGRIVVAGTNGDMFVARYWQ